MISFLYGAEKKSIVSFRFTLIFRFSTLFTRHIQITLIRITAFPAPEKKKRASNAFSHQ